MLKDVNSECMHTFSAFEFSLEFLIGHSFLFLCLRLVIIVLLVIDAFIFIIVVFIRILEYIRIVAIQRNGSY